jgi:ACS family hexuronate transporter-like MFS transporter
MQSSGVGRYRWFLVFFLLLLSAINYGDRSALGVAAGPIQQNLHLSSAQFGIISGAFAFGYAPFNLIGGILGDRLNPKRTLSVFVALWSLTILALPLATGYLFMIINRVLFGVSEGPNYAIATKIGSRWLRRQELGLGISVVTVGSPLGVAILVPFFGFVVAGLGWRTAFIVLGGLSVIWLLVSLFVVANSPAESRLVSAAERAYLEADRAESGMNRLTPADGPRVRWRSILGNSSVQAAAIAYFCFAYTNYMLLSWLPTYFDKTYGYDLKNSAIASAIPWIGAVVGSLVSGWVSDQVLKRTGNARLARGVLIGGCLVIVAILMFLLTQATSGTQGVLLLTAALFFLYATNGLYYVIGASIGPSGVVGRATGYIQAIASIPGFLGPAVTGFIISGHGGFDGAFTVAAAVVIFGGFASFIGITMKRIKVPEPAARPRLRA